MNLSTERRIGLACVLALVLGGAFLAYLRWEARRDLPDGLIQANGRIEGDDVTIASKVAGRIAEIAVREGDSVSAGQFLVRLDDAQLRAQVEQAAAAAAALESRVDSARLALDLSIKEVPLRIASSQAGVAGAEATAVAAEAGDRQARRDADRQRDLVARRLTSRQESERAQLAAEAAAGESKSAREALVQARKQLALAEFGDDRIRVGEADLRAIQAQLEQARATLAEAESVLADLTVAAPVAGVVASRMREPGEVVAAGAPLLELVDLDQLYLKVYVPEVQIGKLRLGLPAQIYTDAFPATPFEATVQYISARAEFTPKEVQTPEERVKLVYAVKLYLKSNPDHRLTPGLPADAVIRWKDGVEWTTPRW